MLGPTARAASASYRASSFSQGDKKSGRCVSPAARYGELAGGLGNDHRQFKASYPSS
jgi:hypothetical protein